MTRPLVARVLSEIEAGRGTCSTWYLVEITGASPSEIEATLLRLERDGRIERGADEQHWRVSDEERVRSWLDRAVEAWKERREERTR